MIQLWISITQLLISISSTSDSINVYIIQSWRYHYTDVISQITSLPVVHSNVYSGAQQRKHQTSVSLSFVSRIHHWPVNSLHKGPVTLWYCKQHYSEWDKVTFNTLNSQMTTHSLSLRPTYGMTIVTIFTRHRVITVLLCTLKWITNHLYHSLSSLSWLSKCYGGKRLYIFIKRNYTLLSI